MDREERHLGWHRSGKSEKGSSNNNSFGAIYKEWYEHKKQVWSVGYATELAKMFDDDILPIIGGLEIQDIEPMQLLEVIRRFEDRGAMERANKARRRCGEVFRYAIVTGRAKYNPAPDLADAMKGYRKKTSRFFLQTRSRHLTKHWQHFQEASYRYCDQSFTLHSPKNERASFHAMEERRF